MRLEALEDRLAPPEAPAPERPQGLRIDSTAAEFELPDLHGVAHKLSDWRGKSFVVAFFNPGCGFCQEMAAEMAALPAKENGSPIPVLVTTGGQAENEQMVEEHGLTATVLLQEDGEITGIATRSAAESSIPRDGLKAGTHAPEFTLPTLDDGELSLAEYRGRRVVLLVFSDPDCGPCEALHRSSSDPSVLVVSRGGEEANRAKAEEESSLDGLNDRFDELTKGLAQTVSRRQALRLTGGALAGVSLFGFGGGVAGAARPPRWRRLRCSVIRAKRPAWTENASPAPKGRSSATSADTSPRIPGSLAAPEVRQKHGNIVVPRAGFAPTRVRWHTSTCSRSGRDSSPKTYRLLRPAWERKSVRRDF